MKPAADIFCTPTGMGLEPVRAGHFSTHFISPQGGSLDGSADYHIRKIDGLSQSVSAGRWSAINFQIPFPEALSAAEVTLEYMFLTTKGGNKAVLGFWQKWRDKVYDFENDMPALFNECSGSGTIQVLKPGPDPSQLTEFQLAGVWPSDVRVTGFDRDSSEPMRFTVSLLVAQIRQK